MPATLPAALPTSVSITKSRHILKDAGDVTFDLSADPGGDVIDALLRNQPFPARSLVFDQAALKVRGQRPIVLGAPQRPVTFSGSLSAYECLALLDEPDEVTALLVRDGVHDDVAEGLGLEKRRDHRYLLLRWGYDLQAAGKGAVALGAGPQVTFGAEGKRLGAYAVIRQIAPQAKSADALEALFQSWMLPSQFSSLDDLDEGTWIVAEVDGSLAATLGAQYGYDFTWVREAVQLGGLSGDIGLKIQAGISATFGFEASGQYAVALGRPIGGSAVRLQLFRLNRKGLGLAYSARATAQGSTGRMLPDHFDDLVTGVLGLHGLQVLRDLEKWTAPDQQLSDLLAGVAVPYASSFLRRVTGSDPEQDFDTARQRLVGLIGAWHELPHRVATVVYALVDRDAPAIPQLRAQLTRLATTNLADFGPELEQALAHVDFFRSPFGQWLESAASTSVLTAARDAAEYTQVQALAQRTRRVLDGDVTEATLISLQREVAGRLRLDAIERIVDQGTFDTADEWLKARLSAFLGQQLEVPHVQQLRKAVQALLSLRDRFFDQAKTALARKYEFEILGSYQRSTTKTALLDVTFDFSAASASPTQLARLMRSTIDGDFDQVLVQDIAGVSLHTAVLTHGVKRQAHLEVALPFLHATLDEITTSLARMEAVQSERGRLLVYDLHADDLKTAKGRFASRFTVHGRFTQQAATRVFDDRSLSQGYTFREAVPLMRRRALEAQLGAYVEAYFPHTFETGQASFATWVADLDRTVDKILNNGPDNFGNTLLALEVSAPSSFVAAWSLAPEEAKAPAYFEMSRVIQRQLRRLIPLNYFHLPTRYEDLVPAAALLVYASLPVTSGILVDSGRIVRFDDASDVYPDVDTPANVLALAEHSLTRAGLVARLVTIRDLLMTIDGMASVADEYRPDRVNRLIRDALTPQGIEELRALLNTERSVIREANAAGVKIAQFLKAKESAGALKRLAEYGDKVTRAFNSKIGSLFAGNELRPLGTLVFLEAARVFDPSLSDVRPSAILELTVLTEKPSFDLASFADGADPPRADVVNTQKFVSLGGSPLD